ncbi:MAG: hypothetical protein MSS99_07010 [Bacteroidales bacterium]|nr:hypothetical protein [Bacteroidales bacterium]MDY3976875.1 hypothetical protein [Candidatus Onthomorpha sp.]
MKRIIFAICTLLCANVLWAQEQLAVLRHNDSTSVFYGQTAFVQAYNAATHGDIITLSAGTFQVPRTSSGNPVSIRKGITVRGNGAVADTARKSFGTYFMEYFHVSGLGDSLQFSAEGIYFDYLDVASVYDVNLTRCYMNRFSQSGGVQATNCIIIGENHGTSYRNDRYINCVLIGYTSSYVPYYATCNNCIILGKGDDNLGGAQGQFQYNNCIIMKSSTSNDTILYGIINNSVLIGFTGVSHSAASGNVAMSLSDVFENWGGASFTDLEKYVLKSSVSDSIQGIDGTEVGIFGGFMPFDWRPSYDIIKRFNVANRTTADGKLSVDIEVISE